MSWKKLAKALLRPHVALLLLLLPLSTVLLTVALLYLGTESPLSIAAYLLAFYTLTVWCLRIPQILHTIKIFQRENRLARRWQEDTRLRVRVSLYCTLLWNSTYALFQLWLGIYHRTFWFCSLAVYYLLLAVMRFFLALHTSRYRPGEQMRRELLCYRACGWIFLAMNLALSLIVFFMVYWNRTFHHHEITTIAMAAYTFTAFTLAIVQIVQYRKYQSPIYSATRAISLAAAAVSMLTLESTMLNTWGGNESPHFRRLMLAATGAVLVLFIVVMAICMIVEANRKLRKLKENSNEGS